MAAQLNYDINQVEAYVGGIYAQFPHDIMSFSAEPAGGIPFGRAVGRGSTENQVVLSGIDIDDPTFLGFSVRELTREGEGALNQTQYDQNETVAVMRDGYFWAICLTDSFPGANVMVADTKGQLAAAPSFGFFVPGARWQLARGPGELSLVHVQLTIDQPTP